MTAPGWHHAQGDPAGTVRYWDGSQWRGDPVAQPQTAGGYELIPPEDNTRAHDPSAEFFTVGATPSPVVATSAPDMGVRRRAPRWDNNLTWMIVGTTLMRSIPFLLAVLVNAEGGTFLVNGVEADTTTYVIMGLIALPLIIQLVGGLTRARKLVIGGAIPILLGDLAIVATTLLSGRINIVFLALLGFQVAILFKATSHH